MGRVTVTATQTMLAINICNFLNWLRLGMIVDVKGDCTGSFGDVDQVDCLPMYSIS